MKTTGLLSFFERINYSWNEDLENIGTICHFTKTRHDLSKTPGDMSYGSEQAFLVKGIAQHIGAKRFFEIGTGRGTSSYSVALEPTVEKVSTVDIVPHFQKKKEAIGYREAIVSNQDLYEMIPFEEKSKIEFNHVSDYHRIMEKDKESYDLAFIDGNHSDVNVILQDYLICRHLLREGGLILFDDYHPSKFAVKTVVDEILKKDSSYEAELVCFHGHIFDTKRASLDNGIAIFRKKA